MTPEENGPAAPEGDTTPEETPAAPLNRAERRAQSKGKKGGPAETGILANLRANKVEGLRGKQSGGKSNNRFMRKV
jgi:hypothetical protein